MGWLPTRPARECIARPGRTGLSIGRCFRGIGGLPYAKVAEVIELLATDVAPIVRREIAAD